MATGNDERAVESKAVIRAVSALAQTHVDDGGRNQMPAPNVIEVLQSAQFELLKNPKVQNMERMRMASDVQSITSELLRAVAIESGNKAMQAVVHVEKGLETVTSSTFLEHTRHVKQLLATLPSVTSPKGMYDQLQGQVVAVERAYLDAVAKTLKEDQGIDVAEEMMRKSQGGIQQSADQVLGRNSGRISDPRQPRGIPGLRPQDQ